MNKTTRRARQRGLETFSGFNPGRTDLCRHRGAELSQENLSKGARVTDCCFTGKTLTQQHLKKAHCGHGQTSKV